MREGEFERMMNEAYLKTILFGGTLFHKLATETSHLELNPDLNLSQQNALLESFHDLQTPGRTGSLDPKHDRKAQAAFPKTKDLVIPTERGKLLHFFANHELLAIETMAFVLLRFPDADPAFRAGVRRTLQDEQRHLTQYVKRMQDFGVSLGDFPLNLYFWNTLRQMKSPIDFVTQMSLTFEQANLDFACFYSNLFQTEIDDAETGRLLKEVHDDEIKHVAHGVKWFNEWRDQNESEYDSYKNLLPYPMTPRRARGTLIFAGESRRKSGMSEDFVEFVRIAGGSRGKVPHYFFFNAQVELEFSQAHLPKTVQQKVDELAPVLLWLAAEEDVVELPKTPDLPFLTQVFNFKGSLPEIVNEVPSFDRYAAFESFKPWGYGQSGWAKLKQLKSPVRQKPKFSETLHLEKLFSKYFWQTTLGQDFEFQDSAEVLIKVAHSTSGRGHLRIPRSEIDQPEIKAKIKNIRARGDEVVIEPYYPKVCDFSVQYEMNEEGKITEFEPRFFKVDHLFQYQGAIIGRANHCEGFETSARLVDQSRAWLRAEHEPVFKTLRENKYSGPFGIDALTYQTSTQELAIKPIIEVNARFTMGRVAQEVERIAQPRKQKQGAFRIVTRRQLPDFGAFSFQELETRLSAQYGDQFVSVTPSSALETWVFVVLHKDAVKNFL